MSLIFCILTKRFDVKNFFKLRLGFFLLALFTGLLVGVATVALIQCIGVLQDVLFARNYETDRISWLANKSDWTIVLAPVFGGIIVGLILRQMPDKRFHGIADVMEASALRAGKMDVRSSGIVGLATLVSLGSGTPLGREGPAVHIGASLTAWLADQLGLARTQSITLLGCAAAAAVTASFNTPIAGVLFALEVVVGYYSLRVFAPVVISAMGAVIVRHSVYGNIPEFSLPDYGIGSLWELLAFAVLGFVAAMVVQCFIMMVIATQWSWKKANSPVWIRPAVAGLIVGVLALSYPLILGVGYEGTSLALNEQLEVNLLLGLLVAKLIGAAIAFGSSLAGGVFSPSLFIGAMLGGTFWYLINLFIPIDSSSQGVYSVVGMAAVASAMLGAPISTLLIVFELTVGYDLVIAVMLASAMASTFMQLMPHGSFFRWQLAKRGVNLNTGRDQSLLRTRTIDDLVTKNFIEVGPRASLVDIEAAMFAVKRYIAIIINEEGEFAGSLSTDDFVAGSAVDGRDTLCEVVMNDVTHHIPDSTSLLAALQTFNELESNYAPITRIGEDKVEVIGVLYKSDVLSALYELVREARSEEYGVN